MKIQARNFYRYIFLEKFMKPTLLMNLKIFKEKYMDAPVDQVRGWKCRNIRPIREEILCVGWLNMVWQKQSGWILEQKAKETKSKNCEAEQNYNGGESKAPV